MNVRLGFSVATAMEPDIVLLDEVLAVGDARFRLKCLHRIGKILQKTAVIYVTHDMNQLPRICDAILLMDRGQVRHYGDVTDGITLYEEINAEDGLDPLKEHVLVWNDTLTIESIDLVPDQISTGDNVRVEMRDESDADLEVGALLCNFRTISGIAVAKYDSKLSGDSFVLKKGRNVLEVDLGRIRFTSGDYVFTISATDPSGKIYYFNALDHKLLHVEGNMKTVAFVQMGSNLEDEHPRGRQPWNGSARDRDALPG